MNFIIKEVESNSISWILLLFQGAFKSLEQSRTMSGEEFQANFTSCVDWNGDKGTISFVRYEKS